MNWNQSQSERDEVQRERDAELAEALKVARFEATWRNYAQDKAREAERGRMVLIGYIVVGALGIVIGIAIGLFLHYVSYPYLP